MDIEIFPAEKSCEQRCSTCPMALKDGQVTATHIDQQVQETYSILEHLLKEHSIEYDLHYAASFNLFPDVKYPELIRMGRFETNKTIGINGNAKYFSNNVKNLLREHGICPKSVAFSIVPDFPIVSAYDSDTIQSVLEEIQEWHFAEGGSEIEVTVRSNLITEKLFEKISSKVSVADNLYLKKVLEDFSGTKLEDRSPYILKVLDDNVYYNKYEAERDGTKVIITNRIIIGKKPVSVQKKNVAQLYEFFPTDLEPLEFAIAPRGVMLMHSSMSINNPAFWLSHSDFRKLVAREQNKPNFNVLEFAQLIVNENGSMYEAFLKNAKDFNSLTFSTFLELFEYFRPQLKEVAYKLHPV